MDWVQRPREKWRIQIDGIEGFAGYLTPVHAYAYTNMRIGDALALLATIPDRAYELVIAIDILEHFEPPQGRLLLAHCARVALVSTPNDDVSDKSRSSVGFSPRYLGRKRFRVG